MGLRKSKRIVAALSVTVMFSLPAAAFAQAASGELLEQLGAAESAAEADRIEKAIFLEWSKSGSAAMDLLLKRGRDALEHVLAENPQHFGALRGVAAIHEQLGNESLAYDAYTRVLELRPFDDEVTDALERLAGQVQGIEI